MENTHLTLRVQAQHPGASRCPSHRSEIEPSPSRVVTRAYPADLVTPVTSAVFAAHVHEHPLVTYHRATGDGSAVKISAFLSRERSHRLGPYAEFFRHLPVEHQSAQPGYPELSALPLTAATEISPKPAATFSGAKLVRTTSGNRRARTTHPAVLAGDAVT